LFLSYLINVFGIKKVAKNLRISYLIFLKEYIFYIIVNFPDGIDILLYSIFTMSLDFLKIHKKQKNRKAEIYYKRKCDVGASKNAGQAFSTKRLSSHFLL